MTVFSVALQRGNRKREQLEVTRINIAWIWYVQEAAWNNGIIRMRLTLLGSVVMSGNSRSWSSSAEKWRDPSSFMHASEGVSTTLEHCILDVLF